LHPTVVTPNVAKVGGLQSQGDKGAAVVDLLQALGNAGSGVLRLSPMSIKQGEKRWHRIGPILKFTIGLFLAKRFNAV
jgi:hypothetical protein